MSLRTVQTLIVGGGISGLCAALPLEDALILEKEPEPGGLCRSIRREGFVWDFAGHYFHFRTERGRDFFQSLFDDGELLLLKKRCAILYRGRLIDYPFQRSIHQLDKEELIDCLCDLFERPHAEPAHFLDMLYAACGRAITEKFLRPYNEKLLACDLRELAPEAMGRFFPAAEPAEIVAGFRRRDGDGSYNSSFYYPKNGAGALVEKLCSRIDPARLLCGRRLAGLDPARHIAEDDRGDRYRYGRLVNTAPLCRFLPLLGTEAARLAASLSASRVLALDLGFEKKAAIRDLHWLYIPGAEAPCYRLGFYDNVTGGERASLYAELAYPPGVRIDADRALRETLAALRAQGIIREDNRLIAHEALLMDPAYVHIRPESEREVRAMLSDLKKREIHSIGRYGGWRYCSAEDCMLEALALADELEGRAAP